jgi:hypothetical protein
MGYKPDCNCASCVGERLRAGLEKMEAERGEQETAEARRYGNELIKRANALFLKGYSRNQAYKKAIEQLTAEHG